jgi:serine/threonine-protein kinase
MTDTTRFAAALADRYHIERELGQGGMATVYLAEDLKHGRQVAIKVLKPELAAVIGPERFVREIRTIAALQHPHILGLIDSGIATVEGQRSTVDAHTPDDRRPSAVDLVYYVMPFVEGESLRDRLARDKQLPVADAVRIATEVASALDYAHRHGVIHRDIKPENILLHDGQALVADFGIALAASNSGGSRMTETGMSLGTPTYMSPEQAMGEREITARADVYALGVVTYEMLTGDPPFTGSTAQAIVARMMTEAPRSLVSQRHTIPEPAEAAVLTALEKLPADRFATAAEFATALAAPSSQRAVAPSSRPASATRWPLLATGAVAVAALGVAAWSLMGRHGDQSPTWSLVALSDSVVVSSQQPPLAVSPDGKAIVFKDERQDGLLWIKHADQLDATPVAGTTRASSPVFSPDASWIGFVADGQVKKVRPAGGGAVTLADSAAPQVYGMTWLDDNTLVYTATRLDRLLRVSAAGGPVTVALEDSSLAGFGLLNPTPLPKARGVLFLACTSGCVTASIHVLDLQTGKQKLLVNDAMEAWYLPMGLLLYVQRDGTGLVAPFNLTRLEITGPATPVLSGVSVVFGNVMLAWSPAGTLVYLRGSGSAVTTEVVRVRPDGVSGPVDSAWIGPFTAVATSPDGRRLAVGSGLGAGALGIWVKQLDRGPFSRLTFGGADRRPAWSPDGRMIAFVRDSGAGGNVFARNADGTGSDRRLAHFDRQVQEIAWSPDGKWIVVRTDNGAAGAGDIVGVRTTGDTTTVPLAASRFTELAPAVSPDGRWLAYSSNETGINEIYVRGMADSAGGVYQVSNQGGREPRWSRDGARLYYLDPRQQLVEAQVRTGPMFGVLATHPLFDASGFTDDAFHQSYDIAADGSGFYFLRPRAQRQGPVRSQAVLITNWFADLKGRLARDH